MTDCIIIWIFFTLMSKFKSINIYWSTYFIMHYLFVNCCQFVWLLTINMVIDYDNMYIYNKGQSTIALVSVQIQFYCSILCSYFLMDHNIFAAQQSKILKIDHWHKYVYNFRFTFSCIDLHFPVEVDVVFDINFPTELLKMKENNELMKDDTGSSICEGALFRYTLGLLHDISKVAMGSLIQLLGQHFHAIHFLFIRFAGQSIICTTHVPIARKSIRISGPQLGWNCIILCFLMVYTFGLYFALQLIPVGDATCLQMSSLLVAMCPLSLLISGNPLGVPKIVAVMLCTTGIIFIWQPWTTGTECKCIIMWAKIERLIISNVLW